MSTVLEFTPSFKASLPNIHAISCDFIQFNKTNTGKTRGTGSAFPFQLLNTTGGLGGTAG